MSQMNFAVRQNKQTLLTRMSALKTVAFMGKKMLWTERKLATIAHRGGMCWHCIKCNAEVFEAQRVQVFCLCFLCSPAQITKAPLRQAPLFFSQNKHTKLSVLACNCPRPREPHVAVLWCTCLRHKLICCAGKTTFFGSVHSRGKFVLYNV